MKLVAYLRVSTDRQAEEGLGLEVQEQAIRSWAKTAGHRIVRCERDEGASGADGIDNRLGLAAALDALRGEAQGIVVFRLDRLARDLVLQEQLLAEVRRLGGRIFSTASGEDAFLVDDPDDPSRKFIRQVLGAVSEYEKSMITLRLRLGRERKAAQGGYAYGAPPYGCEGRDGQLVAIPEQQETLKQIRKLRREGRSLRQIAEWLTDADVPSPRGERWHPATLSRILAR